MSKFVAIPSPVYHGILNYEMVVRWHLDRDDRYNANAAAIRASVRLEQALIAARASGVLELSDEDQAMLCAAMQTPTMSGQQYGYPRLTRGPGDAASSGRDLLPLIDATMAAAATRPEPGWVAPVDGASRPRTGAEAAS